MSSEAIDKGVDAGVDEDIDGDPRPADNDRDRIALPELGADELPLIHLPLVLRQYQ